MKNLKMIATQDSKFFLWNSNETAGSGIEAASEDLDKEKSDLDKKLAATQADIATKSDSEKKDIAKKLAEENPDLVDNKSELGSAWAKLWKFISQFFEDMDWNEEEEKDEEEEKGNTEKQISNERVSKDKITQLSAFSLLSPNFSVTSSARGIITADTPVGLRENKNNTTLEGIRPRTIKGINNFQENIGIPLIISGGTEDGHGGGLRNSGLTHGNGYKLDISFRNGAEEKIEDFLAQADGVSTTQKPAWDRNQRGNPDLKYKQYEVSIGGYNYKILKESDHFDICVT